MAGTLFLVATPIGNLEDISHRAVRVLSEVDVIACEDTRHTKKLLDHYGIDKRTISYHEHNEQERTAQLIKLLETGSNVALVSDAGTPGISDPGFRIASSAAKAGFRVEAVPGPTALIAALVVSGLPTDSFFFGGFLPSRAGARRTRLKEVRDIPATLIFYEAPHRLAASLRDAREVLGERNAVVARELTKIHEEILRGQLSELAKQFSSADTQARGEIVLLIDRHQLSESRSEAAGDISAVVAAFEAEGLDQRTALKRAAKKLRLSRAEAYRRLVAERAKQKS